MDINPTDPRIMDADRDHAADHPRSGRRASWWESVGLSVRIALISGGLVGCFAVASAYGWYWTFQRDATTSRGRRADIAIALTQQAFADQATSLIRVGTLLAAINPGLAGSPAPALPTGTAGPETTVKVVAGDSVTSGALAAAALIAGAPKTGIELDAHHAMLVAAIPLADRTSVLRLSEPLRAPVLMAGGQPVLRVAVHVPTGDNAFAVVTASKGWTPVLSRLQLLAALNGQTRPLARLDEPIPALVTAFAVADHTGRPIGVAEAIVALTRLSEHTTGILALMGIGIALTAALAAAIGLITCQALLAPLRAIAQAASMTAASMTAGSTGAGSTGANGFAPLVVPGTSRADDVGDLARAVARGQQATGEQTSLLHAIQEKEARLRMLAEAMPHIVTIRDRHGHITFNNAWLARTVGADPASFNARDWPGHLHPDDSPRYAAAWDQALCTGQGFKIEYRLKVADGSYRWHVGHATPVRDQAGQVEWWVGTLTDIDAMRRHTNELAARELALQTEVALSHTITNAIQDAIFRCDADGLIVWSNPAAEAMFAGPGRACVGRFLAESVRPFASAGAPAWRATNAIADAATGGTPLFGHSEALLRHDGARLEAICSCMPIVADGASTGAVVVIHNVTDRRQAEAERIALLGRLVEAQEAERLRIARDLHDGLGQDLTALMFGLASLERITEDPSHRAMLRTLRDLADAVGASAHRAAWETRPTSMDDIGLVHTLETHLEDWGQRFGIQTDFQAIGEAHARLPPDVENAVFRVAQEALTNIARHAQASTVSVVIAHRGRGLVLIIEDDGQGFDIDRIDRSRLGVAGMRERLALIDGTLTIESRRGAGTTIFARVILPATVPPGGVANPGEAA